MDKPVGGQGGGGYVHILKVERTREGAGKGYIGLTLKREKKASEGSLARTMALDKTAQKRHMKARDNLTFEKVASNRRQIRENNVPVDGLR